MVNEEKPELCPAKEEGKTKGLSEGDPAFSEKSDSQGIFGGGGVPQLAVCRGGAAALSALA